MILSDNEISERLESPLNLMNRLRNISSSERSSPCFPPSSDKIIDDLEEKITQGSLKSKASNILSSAMDELKKRLPEVSKPEKLAQIASEMAKVVNAQPEKKETLDNKPQIIIYAPQMINENNFETLTINE